MVDQTTQPEQPNQIIPVGDGFLIAIGGKIPSDVLGKFLDIWKSRFPGVPMIVMPESKLVRINNDTLMFEFGGELTKERVDDFRAWWDERQPRGDRAPGQGFNLGVPYGVGPRGPSWARGGDVDQRGASPEGDGPDAGGRRQ